MDILSLSDPLAIGKTLEVLIKGGLAILPTDTVYGLVCDATALESVEKLYAAKRRPIEKPMAVFVADTDRLKYLLNIDESGDKIVDKFLPGALTLVARYTYPEDCNLAWPLLSEDGNLGVRVPDHEFCLALASAFGRPLVATSVNFSDEQCITDLNMMPKQILDFVDIVIDGGPIPHPVASTVLSLADGAKIIRSGSIKIEDIMKVLGI